MARVKMFAAIPRKLGVSTDYFHDHWRHPHGTMGRLVPTLRRYIQSHRIHSDFLDDSQASFDGCAEVWFDNAQDALNFADEPYYVANIKPDELLFIDMPRLEYVFTQEEMLSTGDRNAELLGSMDGAWCADDRALSVKLIQLIGAGVEQPWRPEDYELGRRIGALRQVQCRPIASLHPDGAFVSGVRELWWPTLSDMRSGIEADRAAWNALVDREGSTALVATAERFI